MPSLPRDTGWAAVAVRAVVAMAGIALAAASFFQFRSLSAVREETFAWLVRTGVHLDAADLDREHDPERVRLRAARAVVAAELAPSRSEGLPPERAARESAERMAEAARVGGEILARRPASWEAAQVMGTATYLGWAQARDPRLFTEYRRWEAPLELALRLAPSRREPVRFLAGAYLEIWPALTSRKRGIARGLLIEIFHDPQDLGRLLEPWLDRARNQREAFSVLPDDPEAWELTAEALGRRGDWPGYDAARRRTDEELLKRLRRDLLKADRLRSIGSLVEARSVYLSVAERARPEARFLPLLERALERCPPGLVDRATSERLTPHLAQALDRCMLAGCQMAPAALKRLANFVREQEPAQAALAALFCGDLPRATLYERRTEGLGNPGWAPYLVAKARVLAARGRIDEAREALSLVHTSWQGRSLYWRALSEVAAAEGDAGARAEAAARLAAFAGRAWPAAAWTWHQGAARLEMVTGEPAAGLAIHLDAWPKNGAVLELRLDGTGLGAFPVRPAQLATGAVLVLPVMPPLRPGIHLLEIANANESQIAPGAVEIR